MIKNYKTLKNSAYTFFEGVFYLHATFTFFENDIDITTQAYINMKTGKKRWKARRHHHHVKKILLACVVFAFALASVAPVFRKHEQRARLDAIVIIIIIRFDSQSRLRRRRRLFG